MRKTAFFMENIDHLPSKELLMQAGFTEQDINQEVYIGRKSQGNYHAYFYITAINAVNL